MDDKQLFEALRLYIPASILTVDGCINYFKTLSATSVRRIDLNRTSLEIHGGGIVLYDYEQHKTQTYDFTPRALKDFLLKNWPQSSFNINNQTVLFEHVTVQLNNSF